MHGLLRPSDLSGAPRAAAFAVLVVLSVFVHSASARLTVMHGFVDYTSALVWIQADAPGPVEVVWRTEGDDRDRRTTLDARAADDNVVIARLTGLLPGRTVSYAISGDGDRREGTLRTQPRWTRPADAPAVAIAIGSCVFLADANSIWGAQRYGGGSGPFSGMAGRKPAAMVWL